MKISVSSLLLIFFLFDCSNWTIPFFLDDYSHHQHDDCTAILHTFKGTFSALSFALFIICIIFTTDTFLPWAVCFGHWGSCLHVLHCCCLSQWYLRKTESVNKHFLQATTCCVWETREYSCQFKAFILHSSMIRSVCLKVYASITFSLSFSSPSDPDCEHNIGQTS